MASNQGQQLLKDFTFTPKRANLFPFHYRFDWSTLTLGVSGFKVTQAGFPKEASYMEVLLGVIRFDFETRTYRQVIEAPLIIERHFSGDTFNLSVSDLPDGVGILFAMVRVAFYQEVNGEGYLLQGGDGFGVEVVGVEG